LFGLLDTVSLVKWVWPLIWMCEVLCCYEWTHNLFPFSHQQSKSNITTQHNTNKPHSLQFHFTHTQPISTTPSSCLGYQGLMWNCGIEWWMRLNRGQDRINRI
jgi:hypothetical protein